MTILEEKLYNLQNKLTRLLVCLSKLNLTNIVSIPKQLREAVFGENKLGGFISNGSQISINEDDFKFKTDINIKELEFRGCESLTNITIPDSITSIGKSAFEACPNLTSITTPVIGSYFGYMFGASKYNDNNSYVPASLKEVIITAPCTTIGNYAFYNCDSLTSVTIPDSVTTIGAYAFYDCDGLTSISIGDNVTSIGQWAFSNTGYSNNLSNHENNLIYIGKYLVGMGSNVLDSYTIKEGTEIIADGTFNGRYFTSVTIPNSVINMGDRTFYDCDNLTSITLGNNVTSIGNDVFYNCNKLTSITIPNSVTRIGANAFYNCNKLTSITIPNSVTRIGALAFHSCDNLASITLPDSITSIKSDAFDDTSYYNNNQNWENNVLYIDKYLIKSNTALSGSCIIKEGTRHISDKAFYNCTNLTSVTIPNSVIIIEDYAFEDCTSLTNVTMGDSVTTIGDHAFWECGSLTSISLPDSVTTIGERVFDHCTSLISITIPDSVTTIGEGTFFYCTSLTSVTIGDSVTTIGKSAFQYCYSLTNITIPDSVTSIGDHAFYDCDGLTSITIPDSVTTIGEDAFYSCGRLKNIYLKSTTPPSLAGTSAISTATTTIHVPVGSGEAYKSATNWSSFASKIVENPEL